ALERAERRDVAEHVAERGTRAEPQRAPIAADADLADVEGGIRDDVDLERARQPELQLGIDRRAVQVGRALKRVELGLRDRIETCTEVGDPLWRLLDLRLDV